MPSIEKIFNAKGTILADIVLHFGQWTGSRITEMLDDPKGEGYIRNFLLSESSNFPTEFQNNIVGVIERCDPEFLSHGEEDVDY